MTTREEWLALADMCAKAKDANGAIDAALFAASGRDCGFPIPAMTDSIDAIVSLIKTTLPGWIWKACECSVSDDAWLCPDYNDPRHSERLRRELGEPRLNHWTNDGIDIERRPSGNPALALCEAFCRAMAEKAGAPGRG